MTMHEGLVDQASKFKKRVASVDTTNYKLVRRNQLVVGFPIDEGVLSFQGKHDEAIVSPAYDIWDVRKEYDIEPAYLERFLRSPRALAFYRAKLRGTTARRRTLPDDVFLKLNVPLPLLSEQRRVVECIDRADALRTRRRAVLAKLEHLTQSIFLDMFGDPASNPLGIRKMPLGEIADISTGGTPSRSVDGFYGGDVPWVKTTEVRGDAIEGTEERLTEAGLRAIRGKLHAPNSIVVAMYGQGRTRGQSGLLAIEAAVNQACAVVAPNPHFCARFMLVQMRLGYERLRALGRGGNQENLNLNLVGSFPVLLPPLAHQSLFVGRIEAVGLVKISARESLARLNLLSDAIRGHAFGESRQA
jgi:type I restriction enzyme S subunit